MLHVQLASTTRGHALSLGRHAAYLEEAAADRCTCTACSVSTVRMFRNLLPPVLAVGLGAYLYLKLDPDMGAAQTKEVRLPVPRPRDSRAAVHLAVSDTYSC